MLLLSPTVDSYQQVLEMLQCLEQNLEQDTDDVVKAFTTSHPATPNARRRVPRRLPGYTEAGWPHELEHLDRDCDRASSSCCSDVPTSNANNTPDHKKKNRLIKKELLDPYNIFMLPNSK